MPARLIPRGTLRFNESMKSGWMGPLVIGLLSLGCAGLVMDQPELPDLSGEDEGQKNLAAIRALLAEQEREFGAARERAFQQQEAPGMLSREAPASSPAIPRQRPLPPPAALQKNLLAPPEGKIKFLWVPDPPPSGSNVELQRQVPAHTFFAPVGSPYPGTIRCIPDQLGGQRCQAE
jgi:hypothetical protein